MGIYNILKLKSCSCPNCQHIQSWAIQFKYGDCWRHEYNLFDELVWDRNDVGVRAASIVLVEGISEDTCQNCLKGDFYARIFIDDNKIVTASLVIKNILFPIDSDGDYLIIN
ncbi:hypothetical protein FHW36_104213 [Chitinophaga polysaccharea]|uniref:Uncharacterized protein n=1 Tax=Chitinophaga polysaccharea TaxID=1293035 RepID=A0A561PR30_9BACT|nr:hypothetical protein [Chitinophaga polysaccharea]TWF40531.1 hypothetical protein FHW36_104213 [Chitinophaga polysaccharea]